MKKHDQLGMNPSTASGRLVKDLLFSFVKDIPCHRCGGSLTRDTFSIEHIEPWLDSNDPSKLFFDLANIAYSHLRCNVAGARKFNKKYPDPESARQAELKRSRDYRKAVYSAERRTERYKLEGR